MTHKSIKIYLLFFISSFFISCKGQVKSELLQTEKESFEIGQVVSELDNRIWRIFQDSKGNYWFGSNGNGVYSFDNKIIKQFTTKDGLLDDQIRGIQEDNQGNIYFETPNGISKYDGKEFSTLKVIMPSNNQWQLEPNDLWFGYSGNKIYRSDGMFLHELKLPPKDLKKAFGKEEVFNNNPYSVYCVYKDKEGAVWIGTETAGAYRYDGKTFLWFGEKELSNLPDGRVPAVRAIIQDKDGYFWLSNFLHKYKINPELSIGYEKINAADLQDEIIKDKLLYFNSAIADDKGNLWMTTYNDSLWKYDGKTLSNLKINNDKEKLLLVCIYQDSNGTIWLGTNNDGVYKQNGDIFEKFIPN